MPLDDIVVPNLVIALTPMIGSDDSLSPHVRAVRYGEQLQVAQPPECWIINTTGAFPEGEGSGLEQSDWELDLRLLFPYEPDQQQPEIILSKLIEPFRQVFRNHLKMGDPAHIARARIKTATWSWTIVNDIVYRQVSLRLAVREKSHAQFQA